MNFGGVQLFQSVEEHFIFSDFGFSKAIAFAKTQSTSTRIYKINGDSLGRETTNWGRKF